MHRRAKRTMVVGGRAVIMRVLFQGREFGMRVGCLYRTHHADEKNAGNRNHAQP